MKWFEEALKLYKEGKSYNTISKELNINEKTVQSRFLLYKKKNNIRLGENILFKNENEATIEIHSDSSQTSTQKIRLKNSELKNPRDIMAKHGYNNLDWELLSCKNSIWNAQSTEKGTIDLYSSKITVKPKFNGITFDDIEKHFKNLKPSFIGKQHFTKGNKIFELPIMDLHIGKLAWIDDSGENFDSKILKKIYLEVISQVYEKIKDEEFDYILFPVGNDLLNIDNLEGNTTGGTRQDNDGRLHKMFNLAVDLMVETIAKLQEIAPVKVIFVAGNHSKMAEFYITRYLEAYFRNCKDITFDSRPIKRKYHRYGNTLIGFSHGETEKKRIEVLMQVEAKKDWGETEYHEFHLGHLHSEQTREVGGVIIRSLPSITLTDNWHFESGYVGAIRKLQCFVIDKEEGITEIYNFKKRIKEN